MTEENGRDEDGCKDVEEERRRGRKGEERGRQDGVEEMTERER